MMRKKRYNLSPQEIISRNVRKAELFQQKEKVYLDKPWVGYCDNTDHPLFSIKVDENKKWCACYYCSKVWILGEDNAS